MANIKIWLKKSRKFKYSAIIRCHKMSDNEGKGVILNYLIFRYVFFNDSLLTITVF